MFSQAVPNVSLDLGDIDGGGSTAESNNDNSVIENWQDIVVVSGLTGATPVAAAPSILGGGSASAAIDNSNIYNTATNAVLYPINGDTPSTGTGSTRGNARIQFSSPITSFRIDYRPGTTNDLIPYTGPSNPTSQFIRLHDVNFTAIPEPSALLCVSLVLPIAGVTKYLKSRKAARSV